MYLKELFIDNFRNLKKQKIEFSNKINILYGKNAQGKSNILEIIRLLSIGKSFRNSKNNEMVNYNSSYFYIKGVFDDDINKKIIEISYKKDQNRVIRINNNKIKYTIQLVGNILTTIFSPEDLNIIKGSPSIRRRYIDTTISMIRRNYLYNLLQYNKVLYNRNKLLKELRFNSSDKELLNILDEQIVNYGSKIILYRQQYIKNLDIVIKKLLYDISGENADLKYENNVNIDTENIIDIKSKYLDNLKNSQKNDIKYCQTQFGPHRDDFKFNINGYNSKIYSSQGQQRTAVLCLKLGEQEIILKETGSKPILLLDDVMSELDMDRQKYIYNMIQGSQVIITHVDKKDIDGNKYLHIQNGSINEE